MNNIYEKKGYIVLMKTDKHNTYKGHFENLKKAKQFIESDKKIDYYDISNFSNIKKIQKREYKIIKNI